MLAVAGAAAIAALAVAIPVRSASASSPGPDTVGGLTPGSIQHVWLIILENKSYDETFTGLNNNSYLWQTLPSEGVLLKNYYGTGHSSQDNYIALASGQGPRGGRPGGLRQRRHAVQSNSTIITTGSVGGRTPNWNYGQVLSLLGANAPPGTTPATTNGCTYPTDIPTLFDQFNAAGVSWKGYAQDLGGAQPIGSTSFVSDSVPGRDDGSLRRPGNRINNPVTNPIYLSGSKGFPSDVNSYTAASLVAGTGTANNPQYSDQYVAKHFPFPWFASLTGGGTGNPMGTPLTEPSSRRWTTATATTSPTWTTRTTASSTT